MKLVGPTIVIEISLLATSALAAPTTVYVQCANWNTMDLQRTHIEGFMIFDEVHILAENDSRAKAVANLCVQEGTPPFRNKYEVIANGFLRGDKEMSESALNFMGLSPELRGKEWRFELPAFLRGQVSFGYPEYPEFWTEFSCSYSRQPFPRRRNEVH